MTSTTPQVGDTITTVEAILRLPDGSALVDRLGVVYVRQKRRWLSVQVGALTVGDLAATSGLHPFTILYLPGHPPRPEREVKAEALREAAAEIASLLPYGAELRHDGSEDRLIAAYADGLRESHTAVTQRADYIARGDA